jgi:hypothetical protein
MSGFSSSEPSETAYLEAIGGNSRPANPLIYQQHRLISHSCLFSCCAQKCEKK